MKKIKELMEDSIKKLEELLKPENVRISEAIADQLKPESIRVEVDRSQQYEEIEIELEGFDYCVYAEVEINSCVGDHSAWPYEPHDYGAEIDEVVFQSAYCEGHDELNLTDEAIETIEDSIH